MMEQLSLLNLGLVLSLSLLAMGRAQAQISEPEPVGQEGPSGEQNQTDTTLPDPGELTPPLDSGRVEIDRPAFEELLLTADAGVAVQAIEEYQALTYGQYLGLRLFGEVPTVAEISQRLASLGSKTGNNPAVIYAFSLEDQLVLLLVLPTPQVTDRRSSTLMAASEVTQVSPLDPMEATVIRKQVPAASRQSLAQAVTTFRREVSNPSKVGTTSYLASAQQLYQWLIAPLATELEANEIDTLIFSVDEGLRSLPMAALHDNQQFLVENYSVALVPSFGLTDTRYLNLTTRSPLLGLGISEATQGQSPLPAVAVEVPTLADTLWSGQPLLNQAATLENLKDLSRQQAFGIVHLATHARFRSGNVNNSYIQFWNQRLQLGQLRELSLSLGWNTPDTVEMLVLSACQTALGNRQAELGFSGLALQSGVKTALGSLWYVGDEASLGLMTKFYQELKTAPIKTEALRQAQLALLAGQVRVEEGQLRLSEDLQISLPPDLAARDNLALTHPYFWSAYTMIGNWN